MGGVATTNNKLPPLSGGMDNGTRNILGHRALKLGRNRHYSAFLLARMANHGDCTPALTHTEPPPSKRCPAFATSWAKGGHCPPIGVPLDGPAGENWCGGAIVGLGWAFLPLKMAFLPQLGKFGLFCGPGLGGGT